MPGWDHSNSRPLCVFAEADTRAFVIRMAIVPPKKLNSYFKLTVPYTRISGGSTSGLLSAILDKFSDNYNLWRVFNDTNVNKDHFEKGEATLFGQDESTLDDHGSGESVAAQVRTRLKDLDDRDVTLPQSTVHMGPVKVKPLRYQEIRANLEEQHEHDAEFKYQVFLSSDDTDVDYAREIFTKLKAAGIGCFWYKVNIVGGTRIPDAILEAIEQSEEMCVLVTQNSVKSIWVASEWGAMWAKGRRIISVLTQEVNERRLPEQLRSRAFYKYPAGVEQYIKLLEQPL